MKRRLPAADIDLLVGKREDVDAFGIALSDSSVDTIETSGPGPWQHFVPLLCGRHTVPTVCLELCLITELYRLDPIAIDLLSRICGPPDVIWR